MTPQLREDHGEIDPAQLRLASVRAVRNQAGAWTLRIRVEGKVALADGRELAVDREIRIGGLKQRGRRPHRKKAN